MNELEPIVTDGITEQELAEAKNLVVGNLALTLETNRGIIAMLLVAELYGLGLDYPARHESIYRGITRDEVNAAAQRYLCPHSYSVAIAGPYRGESPVCETVHKESRP